MVALNVEEQGHLKVYYVLPSPVTTHSAPTRKCLCLQERGLQASASATEAPNVETSAGRPESSAKRQAVQLRPVPSGVKLNAMPRDGNCLPAALAAGIAWNNDSAKPTSHRQVRGAIVAAMRKKKATFGPFWDGCDTTGEAALISDFEAYLAEAALDGRHLGYLEIAAARHLFNLTVYVIPTSPPEVPTRHGTRAYPVALQYAAATSATMTSWSPPTALGIRRSSPPSSKWGHTKAAEGVGTTSTGCRRRR